MVDGYRRRLCAVLGHRWEITVDNDRRLGCSRCDAWYPPADEPPPDDIIVLPQEGAKHLGFPPPD